VPRLSVVTPVDPGRAEHLPDAARSLAAQAVPSGWDLEWCIQIDGADASGLPQLPADVAPSIEANGRRYGAAITRNLALARCTGEWVAPLDADDALAPGGLAACFAALDRWPEARWVAGPYRDLLPDGELVDFPLACDEGWVEPGTFGWDGDWPWVGAGGLLHADVLRAVGGWAAIPRSEDLAPWCVIVACYGGIYLHTVLGHYRKWPGQSSASDDMAAKPLAALVRTQIDALRRIGGLPPPHLLS
jgi:hypothetical protein